MTVLPTAPTRADISTYRDRADLFFPALTQFSADIDPLVAAGPQLLAAVNFKGTWVAQSYTLPSTVWHAPTAMLYLQLAAATSGDVPGVATTKWLALYDKQKLISNPTLTGASVVDFDLSLPWYRMDLMFDAASFNTDTRTFGIAFSTNGTTFGSPYVISGSVAAAAASSFVATLWRGGTGPGTLQSTYASIANQSPADLIASTVKARIGPVSAGAFNGAFDAGTAKLIGYRT